MKREKRKDERIAFLVLQATTNNTLNECFFLTLNLDFPLNLPSQLQRIWN